MAPRPVVELHPVGDIDGERDEVTAVNARSLVVHLDHVSEQQRRAPWYACPEFERVRRSGCRRSLPEDGHQQDQRHAGQVRVAGADASTIATKRPIGARAPRPPPRRRASARAGRVGGVPNAYQGRDVETTKSTANWREQRQHDRSAIGRRWARYAEGGEHDHRPRDAARTLITSPAAYRARITRGTARSGCASRFT